MIADDFGSIGPRLKEIQAEQAKARGVDPGVITDQPQTETIFHFYGTPVVHGGCYQAPDDFMG